MEVWDAYTVDGSRTGKLLVRGDPIPQGLYHLVCEVLVRHRDGSYLCMKRDRTKEGFPSWWEATAGGSALAGEDKRQCAVRELKEETGLDAGTFEQIGFRLYENRFFHSFLCVVDCPKDSVRLQMGETEDYRWVDEETFISFVNSEEMIPVQKQRYQTYFERIGYIREERG